MGNTVVNGFHQLQFAVFKAPVLTISVSGLHKEIVGIKNLMWVFYNQLVLLTQIPGKNHLNGFTVCLNPQFQDGRPQNMPRISKPCFHPRFKGQHLVSFHGMKAFKAGFRVFSGVQRGYPPFGLAGIFAGLPFSIHLLNVGRVQQHDLAQFRGWGGCNNFPLKSILYQLGNPPAMIDVTVGEKQDFNFLRIKPPRLPVAAFHLSPALKKPAVHQNFPHTGRFYQIAGTGNASRGTQTCNSDHMDLLSWHINHHLHQDGGNVLPHNWSPAENHRLVP